MKTWNIIFEKSYEVSKANPLFRFGEMSFKVKTLHFALVREILYKWNFCFLGYRDLFSISFDFVFLSLYFSGLMLVYIGFGHFIISGHFYS